MQYENWNKELKTYFKFGTKDNIKLSMNIFVLYSLYPDGNKDLNAIEQDFLNSVKEYLEDKKNKQIETTTLKGDFGVLCALSYCAYLRENQEENTEIKYRNTLNRIGENENSNIVQLYENLFKHTPFIQPPTDFLEGWRYCRYPIYHCILNREDYKYIYERATALNIEAGTVIGKQLAQEINNNIQEKNRRNFLNNEQETVNQEIILAIQHWDGNQIEIQNNRYSISSDEKSLSKVGIILSLYGTEIKKEHIFITPKGKNEYLKSDSKDFETYIDLINNTEEDIIFVLQENKGTEGELYKKSTSFRADDTILILTQKKVDNITTNKDNLTEIKADWLIGAKLKIYKLEGKDAADGIKNLYKEDISFTGGLKLNRNTWLKGAGPKIDTKAEYTIQLNNKNYEGDLKNLEKAEEGKYTVKLNNQDYNITIEDIKSVKEFKQTNFSWERKNGQLFPVDAKNEGIINGFQTKQKYSKIQSLRDLYLNRYSISRHESKQENQDKLITDIRRELYGK